MKSTSVLFTTITGLFSSLGVAEELFPALSNSPALSLKARNPLDRRSVDYCYASTYYCIDTDCCGITTYNCLPTGAECCASLSKYGYGLFCPSGSTCVINSGYVQCQRTSGGGFISAGSSLVPTATGISSGTSTPTSTRTRSATSTTTTAGDADQDTNSSSSSKSSSSSSGKKKKGGKGWIAGAVAGPLLGIALIAAVTFFLFIVRRKKAKKNAAAASAAAVAQNNNPNPPHDGNGGAAAAAGMTQESKPAMYAHTATYEVPPTPLGSPPPQYPTPAPSQQGQAWQTPASPSPTVVAPVPIAPQHNINNNTVPPPQVSNELYGGQAVGPVSPMSTGNGVQQQGQQQQQQTWSYQHPSSNAMELPTAPAVQNPRGGAHEMG